MAKDTTRRGTEKRMTKISPQFYLLECEVVGEEVSLIDDKESKKLIVQPARIYSKSSWIGMGDDVGVLFVEGSSFKVKQTRESLCVGLDENKTLCVKIGDNVCFDNLEKRGWSRVVLRLERAGDERSSEGGLTVVGFKALF